MDIEAKILQNQAKKRRMALVFGTMAGLSFSLVAWGLDGFLLARSHAVFPWLQFVLGAVPTALIGMLAGWITMRFMNLLTSFVVWFGTGMLFARIGSHVPFDLTQSALQILAPDLARQVSYPYNDAASGYTFLIYVVLGIVTIIAGLLAGNLIEAGAEAGSIFGLIVPLVFWFVIFGFGGFSIENNFSERFRRAITGTDSVIQYSLDHEGKPVDPKVAQQINLKAMEAIQDVIQRPRRLYITQYDEYISAMTVRVDFDGIPVDCSVLDGRLNFCEKSK